MLFVHLCLSLILNSCQGVQSKGKKRQSEDQPTRRLRRQGTGSTIIPHPIKSDPPIDTSALLAQTEANSYTLSHCLDGLNKMTSDVQRIQQAISGLTEGLPRAITTQVASQVAAEMGKEAGSDPGSPGPRPRHHRKRGQRANRADQDHEPPSAHRVGPAWNTLKVCTCPPHGVARV